MRRCLITCICASLLSAALAAAEPPPLPSLNPAATPAENFDLANWYLGLPVGEEGELGRGVTPARILPASLVEPAYYREPPYTTTFRPYFHTGQDGALIFTVPADGAAGSLLAAPRCELRETAGAGKHYNWTPESRGGVHALEALCVIRELGAGKVAIGQIHAKDPNVPTIILRYDHTRDTPVIYVNIKREAIAHAEVTRMDFPGVPLGQPIAYRLEMRGQDGVVTFTCTVNGQTQSTVMPDPAWWTATQYFKAGAYYTHQDGAKPAQVAFYQLRVLHGPEASPPRP